MRLAELYAKQWLSLEARSQYQIVAQQCLKTGDVKKAIELHQSMAALDPADLTLRTTLADLMAGDGRAAEAADEYARIGAELDRKGKAKEARAAYQKAASLHPGSSAMAVRVAETHLAEGDVEGAMTIVRESLKKGDNADLHALMSEIHLRASHPDEAVASLERAVTLAPTRYEFTIRLARARLKCGNAEATLRTIESRCEALARDGKGKDAMAVVQEVPGHDAQPGSLRLLLKLAECAQDAAAAIRWGEKLALHLIASGQREDGRRLAERILSMSPPDDAIRRRLEATRESASQAPVAPEPAEETLSPETASAGPAEIPEAPHLEPEDESDIAVLVRQNSEALLVQKTLAQRNVPSVLHSTENLFDSREALEVRRFLSAVAEPNAEPLLKAALSTQMFKISGEDLEQLMLDEARWEDRLVTFRGYHKL